MAGSKIAGTISRATLLKADAAVVLDYLVCRGYTKRAAKSILEARSTPRPLAGTRRETPI